MWHQYSLVFAETLFHSIWQAAILFAGCFAISRTQKKAIALSFHPNQIIFLLGLQLVLSLITYSYLITHPFGSTTVSIRTTTILLLSDHPYLSYTLLLLYFVLLTYKTIHTFYNWGRFKTKIMSHQQKANAELRYFVRIHAQRMGIKRNIGVWFSDQIITPITFGYFKPLIILPISLINSIDSKATEMILLHELNHILSKDWLKNNFLICMEHVYFFNPFVRRLSQQARTGMEIRSDHMVINHGYPAGTYGQTLLACAKFSTTKPKLSMGAISSGYELLERVKIFTNEEIQETLRKKKNSNRFLLGSLMLFLGLIFILYFATSRPPVYPLIKGNDIVSFSAIKKINRTEQNGSAPNKSVILNAAPSHALTQKGVRDNKQTDAMQMNTAGSNKSTQQDNYNTPASNMEDLVSAAKSNNNQNQIFISEEIPEEHIRIIKAYELKKVDGQYTYILTWTITEQTDLDKGAFEDSLMNRQIQ
jgi:beta-lactamase regulating signal transducer with metallopeptidase domain